MGYKIRGKWLSCTTMAALLAGSVLAMAEETPEKRASEHRTERLTLPGSEEMLRIEVDSPNEVRVGDQYQYEVRVTNLTDDFVLHDVVLEQEASDGFTIESANLNRDDQGHNAKKDEKGKKDENQREKANDQRKQDGKDDDAADASGESAAGESQGNSTKDDNRGRWTIKKIEPGQTRTIQVTASSDQEGTSGACLAIKSFTPAVCLSTRFVEPDLELIKRAPEQAGVCEELEFEYFIKNKGTGPTGKLTIRDPLEEGLRTAAGEEQLEFSIDTLEPDETRKFVAAIHAEKPGEYASRAIVSEEDGQKTRSRSVKTEIRQAELSVAIDGPGTEYYGRPLGYTVRVTNNGNAPAANAELALHLPQSAAVVSAGDVRDSQQAVEQSRENGSAEAIPTLARQGNSQPRDEQAEQRTADREGAEESATRDWDLGTLAPGETKEVRVTLRGREAGDIEAKAVAHYVCARGDDQAKVTTVAATTTEIISLPALMVAVVDEADPVEVDGTVTYAILVENQGTAADRNVKIEVELPDQLEFEKATGETEAKADGNKLQFEAIDELAAGERVQWKVRAKALEKGDIRFRVALTSDSQEQRSVSEEPTRLFDASDE